MNLVRSQSGGQIERNVYLLDATHDVGGIFILLKLLLVIVLRLRAVLTAILETLL